MSLIKIIAKLAFFSKMTLYFSNLSPDLRRYLYSFFPKERTLIDWNISEFQPYMKYADYVYSKQNLAIYAASVGSMNLLQDARKRGVCFYTNDSVVKVAAEKGHSHILQYLNEIMPYAFSSVICACAAKGGHLEVLKWLQSKGYQWDTRTMYEAVSHDHFQLAEWILYQDGPFDLSAIRCLAQKGNLDLLQKFLSCMKGSKWALDDEDRVDIMNAAAKGGHRHIMEWLKSEERNSWDETTCAFAAEGNQKEIIVWLRSQNCPWGDNMTACAAEHFELLKWLHQQGCPLNAQTLACAAKFPRLDVVKWIYQHGGDAVLSGDACEAAAREGHLEILQWLREQSEERDLWNINSSIAAATHGHFEILKWLRAQDCPININAALGAASKGHLEILKWIRQQRFPWWSTPTVLGHAQWFQRKEIMEWLQSLN